MEISKKKQRSNMPVRARKGYLRQIRETERKQSLAKKVYVGAAAVALLGLLGYWANAQKVNGSPGQFVPSLGNTHIGETATGVTVYNSDPPTSGPHLPFIARWGIHETPILKELQVHNLEDGGVLVQYNCLKQSPECQALVQKLAPIVSRYNHAILAPYPGMSHRIALTAWSRIDKFNTFEEKRIVRFIEAYMGIDHHPVK